MVAIVHWAVLIALTGCGPSPLLNHRKPGDIVTGLVLPASTTCPLDLETFCADIKLVRQMENGQGAVFELRFWEKSGSSVTGPWKTPEGTIESEISMPSMGHGGPLVDVVPTRNTSGETKPGEFQLQEVHFSMPGRWLLEVIWTPPSGQPKRVGIEYDQG